MASFELERVPADHPVVVVAVSGELDLGNADQLVQQLVRIAGGRPLVIDLNRVLFIDSAALHRLFGVAKDGSFEALALAAEPTAPVARTLEIVQFRQAATVAGTVEEAVAALARRRG